MFVIALGLCSTWHLRKRMAKVVLSYRTGLSFHQVVLVEMLSLIMTWFNDLKRHFLTVNRVLYKSLAQVLSETRFVLIMLHLLLEVALVEGSPYFINHSIEDDLQVVLPMSDVNSLSFEMGKEGRRRHGVLGCS
jgi:hypothetical protein